MSWTHLSWLDRALLVLVWPLLFVASGLFAPVARHWSSLRHREVTRETLPRALREPFALVVVLLGCALPIAAGVIQLAMRGHDARATLASSVALIVGGGAVALACARLLVVRARHA